MILDDWITEVYQPDRSVKLKSIELNHLMAKTRYKYHWITDRRRNNQIEHDKNLLKR